MQLRTGSFCLRAPWSHHRSADRILNLALRCDVIGFQFVVTLCGFVIIGLAVLRFYRSDKHRDASLYPRFGLDIFVLVICDCDGVNWQDTAKRWTILESGTSDPLIWTVSQAQNTSG